MSSPTRATSFDFETDTQGWQDLRNAGAKTSRSTVRAASGSSSLEVKFNAPKSGDITQFFIGVPRDLTPVLRAGQTVRYKVWVPASSKLFGLNAFVVTQGDAEKGGDWQEGGFRHIDALKTEVWNEFVVTLPAAYEVDKLDQVGVQFFVRADGWKGSVFIDSVFF